MGNDLTPDGKPTIKGPNTPTPTPKEIFEKIIGKTKGKEETPTKKEVKGQSGIMQQSFKVEVKEKVDSSTLISQLELLVSKELKPQKMDDFYKMYRVKNKLKPEYNSIFDTVVLEQKDNGQLYTGKIITKAKIERIGVPTFTQIFKNQILFNKCLVEIKKFETSESKKNKKQANDNNQKGEKKISESFESIHQIYFFEKINTYKIIIITNYVSSTSLLDIINERIENKSYFTEDEIKDFAKKMFTILKVFAERNIIFRNFSPSNIFFRSKFIIDDFCLKNFYYFAELVSSTQYLSGTYGELWYMSPDMLKEGKYNKQTDLWSVGIILYIMITLNNPFKNFETKEEVSHALKASDFFKSKEQLMEFGYDTKIIEMILQIIHEDPSVNEKKLLEDDFFKPNPNSK